MNKIKVSIVTVSFNQAKFLEETINSVLGQTYKNIEYIVYDGGSSDGSVDILERYSKHIDILNIGPDGGAASALNMAFARATGDVFAYINSDDVLEPEAVEVWVNELSDRAIDVVFGDIRIINESGLPTTLPGRKVSVFHAPPFSVKRYRSGCAVIPQQASAWRRSVHEKVGGFFIDNKSCWDYEFFVDAAICGFKFKKINKILAKFRVHGESISGTNKHENYRKIDHIRINKKWMDAGIVVSRPLKAYYRLTGLFYRIVKLAIS